jgi:cell division transport system permease protein
MKPGITNFFRVIKFGGQALVRNIGISIGNIFIMFIILCLMGGVLLLNSMAKTLITSLEKKVDVSVYFKPDTKEDDILKLQERLKKFPEVKEVEFVSKEMALQRFKETHKENKLLMESLKEVESNPLPASLNIRADTTESYAKLANFLEKGEFKDLIEKVNWKENKTIIEKLFSIASAIKTGGILGSAILVFVAVVVTFNTIRLAIFSKREEIETMKLVGATNRFVRGPFIVEGILIGMIAGTLSFLLFLLIDSLLPQSLGFFGELGVLNFFENNILYLILIQVFGGAFLGAFSSFLATQKYLKV